MSNRSFLFDLAGLLIIAFLVAVAPAGAAVTISTTGGDDTTLIVNAITTAAADDGIVILNPGTYYAHDMIISHSVTIRANISSGGSATNTIIDATDSGRIFDNTGGHDLTIDNLTLQNGNSLSGGAIYNDGGTVTITDSIITDCTATGGGGIGGAIYSNAGTVTMTGSIITGCIAAYAGAIFNVGTVTITNSTITGCSATTGGAIYNDAGTATITSSTISSCTATQSGGAIYNNGGTVTVEDSSTISGCTATNSGAIFNNGDSAGITITGATFTDCGASADGGALYNGGGDLAITGTTFTDCLATDGRGGAIYTYGGSADITGATFTGCRARVGGAIDAIDSTVTIGPGTLFSHCTSTRSGGAIEADNSLTITSATFSECASRDGGAINFIDSGSIPATPLTIISSTFTNIDTVTERGGAIFNNAGTASIGDSTFSGYRAAEGAAIYNHDGGEITIDSSGFSDCSAEYGGAIFNDGDLDISTTAFFSCSASGDGGAIASRFNRDAIIDGSIFSDCWATGAGGALRGLTGSTYTITSSGFTGCRAPIGSAIHTDEVRMEFCRLYDNGASVVYTSTGHAHDNWWGRNSGPAPGEVGGPTGGPEYHSWLFLGITANPDTLMAGQAALVPANLTYNSDGDYIDPASIHVPDDIPVFFTVTQGTGTVRPFWGGTVSGENTTAYTSDSGTVAMVNATVDGESVGVLINVNGAAFTGTPTSGSPPLAVHFTDASVGSPTMWNWSFGDGSWFNTTSAAEAGPVHTYTNTGTYTVSLTVTGAFGTHTLTRAGYIVVRPDSPTAPVVTLDTGEILSDFPSTTISPSATQAGTLTPMTVTVNIGGDSNAWQAVVTGTKLQDLIVTGTVQNGAGSNVTAPPGIVFQYIRLEPARYGTISHAAIHFSVPQSWLDENRIDPKSIVLYHQTANGWEALPTTVVSAKDGTVYFSAESAGFSLFAIAGTPGSAAPAMTVKTVATFGNVMEEPTTIRAVATKEPVITQTTVPPATTTRPAASSPLMNVVLVIAAIGILAGGGFVARRWWIRRQNPALFEEND